MGIFNKLFHGIYYVIDEETLKKYLEKELNFSLENNIEASANINIYLNGEKHHVQIWNYEGSNFKSEQEKGLIFYYDKEEYNTLEALCRTRLNNLPQYFKVELIDMDNEILREFKEQHPNLSVKDY